MSRKIPLVPNFKLYCDLPKQPIMTAKQLRAKLIEQIELGNTDAAKMLLLQYETQLCLEQRENCALSYYDGREKGFSPLYIFENAQMPEI